MPLTILLTGFGPFPGAPFNPASSLPVRLATRRRPALHDVRRVAHVFRTSYAAVDAELPDMADEGLIAWHLEASLNEPEVMIRNVLLYERP